MSVSVCCGLVYHCGFFSLSNFVHSCKLNHDQHDPKKSTPVAETQSKMDQIGRGFFRLFFGRILQPFHPKRRTGGGFFLWFRPTRDGGKITTGAEYDGRAGEGRERKMSRRNLGKTQTDSELSGRVSCPVMRTATKGWVMW